ncbi:Beta-barrel assembly-enhancing protease [Agrobacterium fabrum]|uniref:toll/interleukin-1 receptor domain-containing protein n=1 Tax=Agrobacterium fabrum TaxID=1176649 RepID=UPI001DD3EA71|nr:toll/interleukin-1 receptor domain-containing protein [Agrobacterium fabrum]CAH0144384.1 Beta-barrel assembly-enhancing protease [Agrobacterium fabrum]CAH0191714.1 Beta-barrel assembly-enhancing protease [Agrobacterium fabrum]
MKKVFLSLSYVDADFVRKVHSRLPKGLAYFYEKSFDNGELLLEAMERAVPDAALFVFFASPSALISPWVGFELDAARVKHIVDSNHRILIFPTHPDVTHSSLPKWMKDYWVPRAGMTAGDISRYITATLLDSGGGISGNTVKVVGRGATKDRYEQIVADHLARNQKTPSIYLLGGFRGIGRRTFASYFIRHSLEADINLRYGPTFSLPQEADLIDLYASIRSEVSPFEGIDAAKADLNAFRSVTFDEQIDEIYRQLSHFFNLNQAVTIVSAGGFFEDKGAPKSWVASFLSKMPENGTMFLISNRLFEQDFVERLGTMVQMRLEELSAKNIETLMIYTASRLGIDGFEPPRSLIPSIGGHPDVANAAVRLIGLKGSHIVERDPAQIFNLQTTILGEVVQPENFTPMELKILQILGWVPSLQSKLLEKIVAPSAEDGEDFINSINSLILSCLITINNQHYSISSSIRSIFRRFNPAPHDLISFFSKVLRREWNESQISGEFNLSLFEAFLFMHALEGSSLPKELRDLVTPGTLADLVREAYARGKDDEDQDALKRVISWGTLAEEMPMSSATKEEILSTMARALIRLGSYVEAGKLIDRIRDAGFRSSLFLRGHLLRKRERYSEAIPLLQESVRERKYYRSAIHELALCFKRTGAMDSLKSLLEEHGAVVGDSAMFADFQIGIDLARGNLQVAESSIEALRKMPEDEGKSDLRLAQLLLKRQQFKPAIRLLSTILNNGKRSSFHARCLRAVSAAKDGDFQLATSDVEFLKGLPGRANAVLRIEAAVLAEKGQLDDAEMLLDQVTNPGPPDLLQRARVKELRANRPDTSFIDRKKLLDEANEIRAQHRTFLEYDLD